MKSVGGIGFRENGESIGCRVYREYREYRECRECMRCRDHEDYEILRVKSRDIKSKSIRRKI